MIRVYNTLSREVEELKPREHNKINFFVCGPTVYDLIHIGNAKTYIYFDVAVKYLRSRGLEVFYLQNITDIDDKIIARAKESGADPSMVAQEFSKKYFEDMKSLGIDSVTEYAPATKYIDQIVDQVKRLVEKGFGYLIENDGYYFDLSKFPEYGKLSGRTSEQAEDSISRIDESINKRNRGDFTLWKFSAPEEVGWDTPIGRGRPGWHIEDTAITEKFFGPQYDIHGGGIDIKFPHHEAEIAQQEAASGKSPLAAYWMHVGSLTVNGQKMSKSLGNFITLRDMLAQASPEVIRLCLLSAHYRTPLDYSDSLLTQAQTAATRIADFSSKLSKAEGVGEPKADMALEEAKKKFTASMDVDFNTSAAIASLFELIRDVNPALSSRQLSSTQAREIEKFLSNIQGVLGIIPKAKEQEVPEQVQQLVDEREQYRQNKDWAKADEVRGQIEERGYLVDDTPFGPIVSEK